MDIRMYPGSIMKYLTVALALFAAPVLADSHQPNRKHWDDIALRSEIVRHSVAQTSGDCPCPYSLKPTGNLCGFQSTYYRTGRVMPYCFVEDIPIEAVHRFKLTGIVSYGM